MAAGEPTREDNLYLAKLADNIDRYEDMVEFMVLVVDQTDTDQLNEEVRRLLTIGFHRVISADRKSFLTIRQADNNPNQKNQIRLKIESRLDSYCNRFAKLLHHKCIPSAMDTPWEWTYYLTVEGDMYRYLAELKSGRDRIGALSNGQESYREAQNVAREHLAPTNEYRLYSALNYAIFTHDIAGCATTAVSILQRTSDAAEENLESYLEMPEESFETLLTMSAKIKEWKSEV